MNIKTLSLVMLNYVVWAWFYYLHQAPGFVCLYGAFSCTALGALSSIFKDD